MLNMNHCALLITWCISTVVIPGLKESNDLEFAIWWAIGGGGGSGRSSEVYRCDESSKSAQTFSKTKLSIRFHPVFVAKFQILVLVYNLLPPLLFLFTFQKVAVWSWQNKSIVSSDWAPVIAAATARATWGASAVVAGSGGAKTTSRVPCRF